jgi:hypothetical protein
MKDTHATIIVDLDGKSEEELWRGIKRSRRKAITIAKKEGLHYVKAHSKKDLRRMYGMESKVLIDGGAVPRDFDSWKEYVAPCKDNFFYIKKGNEVIGCFALSEIPLSYFGIKSDKIGIRPKIFATLKKFNHIKTNDFMYWASLKYALDGGHSFLELGGYQIKPRGHLKGVNFFKETWGGEVVHYQLDYPFHRAIGRKLVRNVGLFWWLNVLVKKARGRS